MSDTERSGEPEPVTADLPATAPTPAENTGDATDASVTAPVPSPGQANTGTAQPGEFGATRGSGLLRGKRPSAPAAPTASPAPSGSYKPTALEVITPQSEYRNPFTGETSVGKPAASAAATPLEEEAPAAPTAPVPESSAGLDAADASSGHPSPPEINVAEPTDESKSELKILPPESSQRPPVHWVAPSGNAGSTSAPEAPSTRDERPRREPRERRTSNVREPRDPQSFDPREARHHGGRRDRESRNDKRPRKARTSPRAPAEPTKSAKSAGGFLGWLKGLFGGAPEEPAVAGGGDGRSGGRQSRHRGRGRGGRSGYRTDSRNRGPRDAQRESDSADSGPTDERGDGRRRRRHEDSDRRPRSEGHQGGGAI